MNVMRNLRMAAGLGAFALTVLSGCAVTGVGVDGTVGVGYDAGYYEPWGYDYGGWGYGYRVAPGRGGDRRGDRRDDRRGDRRDDRRGNGDHSRSYRPAPASRPTPSIPGRSRGH
jgi:hypothetical protein